MRPLSFRPPKTGRLLAVATLAAIVAAEPAAALAPPEAQSPNADDIRTAYWVMLVLVTILALGALAGLVGAYLRFRVRSHRDPRQARRVTPARGVAARVAAGLGLLAALIFAFGIVISERADDAVGGAAGDELEINVVGQQWLWRFEYPVQAEGGASEGIATVFSYDELVVPVDTPVTLRIGSVDVLHRWFVPALGGQVQAVPGETAETSFRAASEGVYEGQSTQFSGTGYPAMRIRVRVVSKPEYDAFVKRLAADLREAQAAVAEEVAAEAAAAASAGDATSGGGEGAGSGGEGVAGGGGAENGGGAEGGG